MPYSNARPDSQHKGWNSTAALHRPVELDHGMPLAALYRPLVRAFGPVPRLALHRPLRSGLMVADSASTVCGPLLGGGASDGHTEDSAAATSPVVAGPAKRQKLSASGATQPSELGWQTLQTSLSELDLDLSLPTGQSFRWQPLAPREFVGVLGQRAFHLRQVDTGTVHYRVVARGQACSPSGDAAALRNFFTLDTKLAEVGRKWSQDARFRAVAPHFQGARMLRQDPVQCLFQFICSSNNHISRIHGMVSRLCEAYGTPLLPVCDPRCANAAAGQQPDGLVDDPEADRLLVGPHSAFPTLEQLSVASEEELRAAGFGYRAKFIVGSVRQLHTLHPEGGEAFLQQLRDADYAEASEALCTLPGVGPKVAACVCLFALDKHEAIPVDTHVWQLATRYYLPSLKGKTLTPKVMVQVEKAFQDVFGPYAGWAHNVLFVSELASQRHRLPGTKPEAQAKARRKAKQPAPALEGREILQLETEGSPGAAGAVPRKRRTRRKTAAER